LTAAQRAVLAEAEYGFEKISEEGMLAIAQGDYPPSDLDDDTLVEFLELTNLLYRGGAPLISDHQYDFLFLAELRRREPNHPYLLSVEPEPSAGAKTVELPVRMLSTDKAYDFKAIERWAGRIDKAALELGLDFAALIFRVTPKLDGFAAYDDGRTLYTRGDGKRGTDVTRAFDRGLQVAEGGRRGLGAGEIVVSRRYFSEHLAPHFDNSRNFRRA
jgi:DNA ligase (NAD+)